MLALDPPGDPTLGACLAGDLSGPRRHRYGAMRDLVIGVTVVLADGTIASSGGRVVKNVAGYDLGKLFSGSRGRLGLIARVALRLHPLPAAEATVVVETDDPRGALGRTSSRSQLSPERGRLPAAQPASRVLFEGARAPWTPSRSPPAPGSAADSAIWAESAARQQRRSRAQSLRLAGLPARPPGRRDRLRGPGRRARTWSPLAERVRASFDPSRMLV